MMVDHHHHQTQLIIHVSAAIPIQQFNIQNPNPDEQLQFNDIEASLFDLSDGSEQPPPDS